MSAHDLAQLSADEKYLQVPYDQRWECLKPVITRLFLGDGTAAGKGLTIPKVAHFMKEHYSFSAEAHQYRHQFQKWGVRKRTTGTESEAITTALGKRARPGVSTSDITIQRGDISSSVDKKNYRRFLQSKIREQSFEPLAVGTFAQWNLPYAAYVASLSGNRDHSSPFGDSPSTPDYLNVRSPEATTPGGHAARVSPTVELVRKKMISDRTSLFLQGRVQEMLVHCNSEDRRATTNWLHDFWLHSFVTAKYWGRGPQQWTPELINIVTLATASTQSPRGLLSSQRDREPESSPAVSVAVEVLRPSDLCRWAIHHIDKVDVDDVVEPDRAAQDDFVLEDQSSWTAWPQAEMESRTLHGSMRDAFAHNEFTGTPIEQIPISSQAVLSSFQHPNSNLDAESWAFAIMAGNVDHLDAYMIKHGEPPTEIGKIHPYHLAATYLDGGQNCCNLVAYLSVALQEECPLFRNNLDDNGHTVLDCLLITVLRSHTSLTPAEVSPSFKDLSRFPGEEKNTCGRWDADSPAIRQLYKSGKSRIPLEWKHPFCHSSVQAV